MGGESRYLGLVYLSPYIIGLAIFTAIPFGASLYLAFTDYSLMASPTWVGLKNFERLLTHDRTFVKSLSVTLAYVALTVPLKLAFALFIAVILNCEDPGDQLLPHRLLRALDPRRLDRDRGAVALHLRRHGLVNMAIGALRARADQLVRRSDQRALHHHAALRCWQFGSAMVIFLAALQSVDKSLYEAAAIDGAGKWATFCHITLPLITPVIFFNLIMQMVQAFQEFNGPYIITEGGPLKSTYLLPLYIYDKAFKSFDMGYASAIAWVLFTIITAADRGRLLVVEEVGLLRRRQEELTP